METIILAAAGIVVVIVLFVRICKRLRGHGGSLTTIVLGATDEFLTKDKSKAAETIINENVGQKFTVQRSGETKRP